jgi:hypothetical protein
LFEKAGHPITEFLVAVDKRIVVAEVTMDFLQQSFNSGINSSESSIVELQLKFGNSNKASLTFEEISLEVSLALNIESDHQSLLTDFSASFGLSCVVATIVTRKTHDD